MTRRMGRTGLIAAACLAAGSGRASADIKVDDRTAVKFEGVLGGVVSLFGGKAAKEGVTSTVAVKGDRRARLGETTGEIVDLAEEKVYDLDLKARTYKATTFAEFYKDSKMAKTLRWSDWQEIQGIWTPHFIEMKDLMRGSATRIRVSNVQYNLTFPDDWFSLRNLRRGS